MLSNPPKSVPSTFFACQILSKSKTRRQNILRPKVNSRPEMLRIKLESQLQNPLLSQPLSVKSSNKLQEFKRAASGLRGINKSSDIVNLRRGVSQSRIGAVHKNSESNSNFNVTEIMTKHSLLRSKSNPKGVRVHSHNRNFALAFVIDNNDPCKPQPESVHHGNASLGTTQKMRPKKSTPNFTQIYGETSSEGWKKCMNRIKSTAHQQGRNHELAHSQYVEINKILKQPTFPKVEESCCQISAAVTAKKQQKSTKYTTDETNITIEEGIEEMHTALVHHYQKIKRMLKRVETAADETSGKHSKV